MTVTKPEPGEPEIDDIGVAPGEFGHCEPPDFTRRHPPGRRIHDAGDDCGTPIPKTGAAGATFIERIGSRMEPLDDGDDGGRRQKRTRLRLGEAVNRESTGNSTAGSQGVFPVEAKKTSLFQSLASSAPLAATGQRPTR